MLSQYNKNSVPLWGLLQSYIQEDSRVALYAPNTIVLNGPLIERLNDTLIF